MPALLRYLAVLLLAPLLPALVNRTKAVMAGRRGAPLLQGYYDLWKLLGKSAVYSRTTGWVFRAGPLLGLAAALMALAILPWGGGRGLLSFDGDLFLFAYLFGLMRFLTILAALDTGSPFEGMGASREAWFSALTEPALLLALAALARSAGELRLAALLAQPRLSDPAVPLAAAALFIVFLAENSRLPVDDPNTHLELTMIHEVMVLDHGGPDLAFIQYGAALKLWIFGSLVAGLFTPGAAGLLSPRADAPLAGALFAAAGLALLGVLTGLLESLTARLRLARVPQLLVSASAMSALAMVLELVR
ncbi:MAG: hydrogenase [Spirochaetes bacterium RBG_16_67_19]|nr:MAG: hydrogenase [Spirochaetes bacterium RBG_16_67_19]